MGFTKRHVNQDLIINKYMNTGINGVKQCFNADAIFGGDDFTLSIEQLLYDNKEDEAIYILNSKINNNLDGKSI